MGCHRSNLLAVLLTGIQDSNELALPLTGSGVDDSGAISGYSRADFVKAMIETGVQGKYAEKAIDRLDSYKEEWFGIIDSSFLRDDLESRYKALISERISKL